MARSAGAGALPATSDVKVTLGNTVRDDISESFLPHVAVTGDAVSFRVQPTVTGGNLTLPDGSTEALVAASTFEDAGFNPSASAGSNAALGSIPATACC